MYTRHHRRARLFFALSDMLLTALAFEAAYQTRAFLPFEREFFIVVPTKALLLGASLTALVLLGYWLDIYDRLDSAQPRVILADTFRQSLFGLIAVVLLEFLLRLDLSRPFLLLFGAYTFVLLALFRWKAGTLVGWVRRQFGAPHHVTVVGTGERALRLAALIEQASPFGVRLSGFLSSGSKTEEPTTIHLRGQYPVRNLSELPRLLREQIVDELVFAVDSSELAGLEETFLLCDEEGVRTRVAVDFFPHVNSEVYLDRLGPAPVLTFAAAPHDEIRLLVKRMLDVVVSSVALVVLAPFMLLTAVLVRLSSPGPAIFRQVRCGLNGRRFICYKFRSMVADAEARRAEVEHLNQRGTAFKAPGDPRVTPLGRWLRKFSVDEWPQLWNVLRGDMSLVGPRPPVPQEVEQYKQWQRRRLRMRPGLTCLWAIHGRDHVDFERWMQLDMEYIDNWSLALDWKIMLRTIPSVLTGKGAH